VNKLILVVDDEYRMRRLISDYFKKEGFSIIEAENGEEAIIKFKANDVDLIILDVMMPKLNGWETCKMLRDFTSVPIIMLTARSEEEDELLGFNLGVDDYITKPFSPKILVAKTKALFKRLEGVNATNNSYLLFDSLKIDELSHRVTLANEELNLSPKEYDLLLYLVKNKGLALSRDMILNNVWGYDYYGDLRTVDTHIKRLREKLKDKADYISTIRGSGYRFEVKNEK